MKTIRRNTFETNSSSCHSVTICGQNKLQEFMDKKVIAFGNYEGSSDEGRTLIVPDAKFIPVEKVFEFLKTTSEMPDNCYYKAYLEFLQKSEEFTLEKFREILFENGSIPCPNGYDIEHYELGDVLEAIYHDCPYWNDGNDESNPFLIGEEYEPDSFEGIEGPIATISGEMMC